MMMFGIFLFTDVTIVLIFWAVYGTVGKYREGMLLGVHLPSYRENDPEVRDLTDRYRKITKQFYLWNAIAAIAITFLCFWYYSAFIVVWCLWLLEVMVGSQYLIYHTHRKLYDLKLKRGWSGGHQTKLVAASPVVSENTGRITVSVWFHLPSFLLAAILFLLPSVRSYVGNETDGLILSGICFFLLLLFFLLHIVTNRVKSQSYSGDAAINAAVNRLYKRTCGSVWILCSYVDVLAFMLLADAMDKKAWLDDTDYFLYIILQAIPGMLILGSFFYIGWKKDKLLKEDSTEIQYVDDDIYWRNGWYHNPSDPKLMVQDRICPANYTVNMARPAGKVLMTGACGMTLGLFIWLCFLFLQIDFIPVELELRGNEVQITGAGYDTSFDCNEIEKAELLQSMPEEHFNRTNGLADGKRLIGKFSGKESGDCRLYITEGCSPILHIELPDYHIFMNSEEEGQALEWYEDIK